MRNYSYFPMPRTKTVNHGQKVCLTQVENCGTVYHPHMKDKDSIKTWKPDLCSCRLCRVYLRNIGYLQSQNNIYIYIYIYIYVQKKKIHVYLGKSEYHNRFFSFVLVVHLVFLVQLFVAIYGIYLKFDLGPLALINFC